MKFVTDQTTATTTGEEGAMKRTRDTSLAAPVATRAGWTDLDVRVVDAVRLLAADAVQHGGPGHPGPVSPHATPPPRWPLGHTSDALSNHVTGGPTPAPF